MSEETLFPDILKPVSPNDSLPDPEGSGAMMLPGVVFGNSSGGGYTGPTLDRAQELLRKVAEVTEVLPSTPLIEKKERATGIVDMGVFPISEEHSALSVRIEDELEEAQRIKNQDALQDVHLKRVTLIILFVFLGVETLLIFFFAFLQGTTLWTFRLEEWSFNLLVTATLLQVTYMIQVAVRYLFTGK